MEILNTIQSDLNAPKGQYNNFGKYAYRNCEDILEAVKPYLKKSGATLVVVDEMVMLGDRFYVKATATISLDGQSISGTAFARESEEKKGMDLAQITGAASSYARKYALNGLFCIDDNKDADSKDNSYLAETISTIPVDAEKVVKATNYFIKMINADVDEDVVAPEIKAAYNRLSSDEQIAVNNNLKAEKNGKRQMNTILKGFLDWTPYEAEVA